MKTIKTVILIICAGCVFSSCSDNFLIRSPEGNLNTGNFFNSTEEFEQALNGAYTPLRDIANSEYLMDECRTDNARYFYYAKDRGNNATEKMTNYLTQSDDVIVLNRYKADYVGISRTNTILDRISTISFEMSSADKDRIIGETKALRAHYYFDLVRKFGGVPLFLNEVKTPGEAYKARSSADSVYAQIIADLKDAIGLLKDPDFSGDAGRINKGVASTELGRVYLTRGAYHDAIPYLESVTKMGYSLLPDFRTVFNPANKGNNEMIWAVQYLSGTEGQGSEFIYDFIPIVPNTGPILGADFSNTQGGWDVPTADLMAVFEPGDSRFHASVGVFEGELNAGGDFTVTATSEKNIVGFIPDPDKEQRYFARKFFYPPYPEKNLGTSQNWPIYRYSGVLLMLAECYNASDQGRDPAKALGYLNQVRKRAFGDNNHNVTTTGKAALEDAIALERRRELAFENKRYDDLVRTGEAVEVMNAFGVKVKQKFSYLLPESYEVTTDKLLYPIPFQEIQLNDMLTQNPGY